MNARRNLEYFGQQVDRLDHEIAALHSIQHRRASYLAAHGAERVELEDRVASGRERAAARVAPMTWLLQRFGSEQPLTQAGYLNRTFVLAVHAERPWEDPFDTGRPPRTETDEITLDDALAEGCEREARQLEALQPNGMSPDAVSGARSWTPSDRRVRVTYGALGRAQGKKPGTRSPAHQQHDDDDDQNEEK